MRALAELRKGDSVEAVKQAQSGLDLGDMPTYNHLIIALALAQQGKTEAARRSLQDAIDKWPDDLSRPGQYRVTDDNEFPWFDTYEELAGLKSEVQELLGAKVDP